MRVYIFQIYWVRVGALGIREGFHREPLGNGLKVRRPDVKYTEVNDKS
ncbi:MAG: hypothetical protein ACI9W6_003190 [Motiliproteus sp.]